MQLARAEARAFAVSLLSAWVTGTQRTAREVRVIDSVSNRSAWRNLNNFEKVEVVFRVLFTAHNQNVFEALVVFGTIQRWAVAHAVEFEVFQSFGDRTWVEAATTGNRVCIKQGLNVAGVCCL